MPGGFANLGGVCNAQSLGDDTANTTGTLLTTANNSPGSWVQISAALACDCVYVLVQLLDASSNSADYLVDIGVGASGSEVPIGRFFANAASVVSSNIRMANYAIPLSIPAGSAVSARAQASGFATITIKAKFTLFDGAFPDDGAPGCELVSALAGLTVTPSGTANTKGSYAQAVASTTRDYCGFIVGGSLFGGAGNPTRLMFDLAIGGAGAEVVIIPNMIGKGPNFNQTQFSSEYIPFPVPAGTRIALRAQADNTNATDQTMWVFGAFL